MRNSRGALAPTLALIVVGIALWPAAAAAGDCGFYRSPNGAAVGRHCASTMQAPPPQRVTAMCRDNSYSYDQGRYACQDKGGVRVWLR